MSKSQLPIMVVSPRVDIVFVVNHEGMVIATTHYPRVESAGTPANFRLVVLLEVLDAPGQLMHIVGAPVVDAQVVCDRAGEA